MSIEGKGGHGKGGFATQIGNAKFEFKVATFDDRKITGGQVAEAAGAHPIENFVILAQLPNFEIETLRPQETSDLTKVLRFFVIEGDSADKFFVDGLSLEWPKKKISGLHIKMLVGMEDEHVELLLERENTPDQVIADDEDVHLGQPGVEKFKTRKTAVTIKVNGAPHKWEKPKISYAEVVALSPYAGQPDIPYTITYTKGPNKPEGDLVKGASVHVKDGMDFVVTPTGES